MIIGNAEHLSAYKAQLSEELYDCLEKMAAYGFEDLPDGKYEINGYKVGVETSMTEPADKRKLEGHQRYIDIVYEVDVEEERIGCRSVWEAGKVTESCEDRDLYFFRVGRRRKPCVSSYGRFCNLFSRRFTSASLHGSKRAL